MKLAIIILSLFVGSAWVDAWGGYKINFYQSGLEYDENLVSLEVKMKRIEDKTQVNIHAELYDDINDPIVVQASHFEMVNGEYTHLVNASVSACNVMTRVKAHPILKLILQELLKSSNFPLSCPIKRGAYYMKDFILNDELLPPFLPIGKFMSRVRVIRLTNDEEVQIVKLNMYVDIENEKERKNFKLF